MEEDDADFTPTPNTSSNLASLFGFAEKPLKGNPSLTYTAPKAPKSPAKKSEEKSKAIIIFSKVVQAYKLENGNYVNQGVAGLVISGSHDARIYEIILYKRTKEHLSLTRIFSSFSITLSPNNYVSFYDNNKQNWSILFNTNADVEQFALKLAICKFYISSEASNLLIQDLSPMSQPHADVQSTVEVSYHVYTLNHDEITKIKDNIKEKIKISNCKFIPFNKGLIGCSENGKRVIIVPYSLNAHWSIEISPNKNLLLEIKVEKLLSDTDEPKPRISEDGRESPIDSSAEETSIKARGASIQEALTTAKTQKANLISRMARMGQISLPLKQNLSAGPSDSEEESAVAAPKPRMPRSKTTAPSQQHPEPSQQVSVYQNDVYHPQKIGVTYQQLIPVSASPVASPSTDPNLSVYVSESRIQAAELRMGLSKISDKLDLVWNKVQNLNNRDPETSKPAILDSGGILTSIQSLITENESLKAKVEEQKTKIEVQNDKIFQLLELNHKYLEQNTTSHDKQSASESKLKAEMESLRSREIEAKAESKEALEKIKTLETNLGNAENANKNLKRKLQESMEEAEQLRKNVEAEGKKKELESMSEKMSKASEVITKLKERLREMAGENERLNSVIRAQREEIENGSQEVKDTKIKRDEFERTVKELKEQISVEEMKAERVDGLSKDVERLEEENKQLREELQKNAQNDTKLQLLLRKFEDGKEYTANEILTIIDEVVKGSPKPQNESAQPHKETIVVPAPRMSLRNAETEEKSVEEVKAEPESKDDNEKKEDNSIHKSYDQSWRTMKPPPPPLFDDEDDDIDDWLI